MAFEGTKCLNRIQSVVFSTAYNTNENLLICAPTGAGKTNVAMLTIVHQLRQHIEGDVIMRNKFKVILYILFRIFIYIFIYERASGYLHSSDESVSS